MPRNKFGGNKAKKGKNAPRRSNNNKSLRIKDPNTLELYAKVVSRLGGSPAIILVLCEDGKERKCVVRGKYHKRMWINPDDYVLITCNSEEGEGGEIACKYSPSDVAKLEERKEFSSSTFNKDKDNESNVIFTNDKVNEDKVEDYYSSLQTTEGTKTTMAFNDDGLNDDETKPTTVTFNGDDLDFDDI